MGRLFPFWADGCYRVATRERQSIVTTIETRTADIEPSEAEHLHREIVELRAELEQLKASLAREVRTERLSVVHPDDGREVVYTTRRDESISLDVCWRSDEPGFPSVQVSSGRESMNGGDCGLVMMVGGDSVLDLYAQRDDGNGADIGTISVSEYQGRQNRSLHLEPAGTRLEQWTRACSNSDTTTPTPVAPEPDVHPNVAKAVVEYRELERDAPLPVDAEAVAKPLIDAISALADVFDGHGHALEFPVGLGQLRAEAERFVSLSGRVADLVGAAVMANMGAEEREAAFRAGRDMVEMLTNVAEVRLLLLG
jgi:hypothetical protein